MTTTSPELMRFAMIASIAAGSESNTRAGPVMAGFLRPDRKSTRLNSSHTVISYAVFCLKKKKKVRTIRKGRKPEATCNADMTSLVSIRHAESNVLHVKYAHVLISASKCE